MKITIEPTRELYNARINDATVPVRMWRGRTADGIEIEAYFSSHRLHLSLHDANG
jgi:hypothetical protein